MGAVILLAGFGIFLMIGIPIAFSLGLSSLVYLVFFLPNISFSTISQQMYAGANSFTLTAIFFFVLVGEVMNAGGISKRLVNFARTLVGHLTGGMAMVALVSSMIFASISGSAIANAASTGAITIPAMKRSKYPKGLAAAIESASSSLGAIIPPSIPFIVYGSIAGVSIGGLFISGYIPGVLFAIGLMFVIRRSARKMDIPLDPRSDFKSIARAAKEAGPALLTPIIIMGGILSGVMTPTEAGAVGVLYSFIVAFFIHRDLTLKDIPRVLLNSVATSGVVMIVMTMAAVFSWIMAFESIPSSIAEVMTGSIHQPQLLMLVIVFLLLIVGTFIDTISALIILTPVLVPVATSAGIDPMFLGVIVSIALTFGVCTPPVGTVLFVTSSIAGATIEETSKAIVPFLVVLLGGTFVLALFPELILWFPRLLGFR
jgi:C4-dicarboxylate transporter DctM subunit